MNNLEQEPRTAETVDRARGSHRITNQEHARAATGDRRQLARRGADRDVAAAPKPVKDNWDKLAALAPIISGVLIFAAGGVFTYAFNEQQLRLQEIQTIERFIPHLMGNEQSKKAAILAISSLTNTELAGKFASIFASSGTVSALQKIASTGSEKEKTVATRALNDAIDSLAMKEGQLSGMEDGYKLAINQNSSGQTVDEAELAYNLNKLGELYVLKGQYSLAEPALKRALVIRQKLYGAEHPVVADTLKSLAALYRATGHQDLADEALKEARSAEAKFSTDGQNQTPAVPAKTASPVMENVHDPAHQSKVSPKLSATGSAVVMPNAAADAVEPKPTNASILQAAAAEQQARTTVEHEAVNGNSSPPQFGKQSSPAASAER